MLVFIDESGYPRPNDNNKISVLFAVCIYEKDIKSLTNVELVNANFFQLLQSNSKLLHFYLQLLRFFLTVLFSQNSNH